jgi:hypothetical protein
MIAIPSGADIYLCTTATDMRKSFDGLSGIVRAKFGRHDRCHRTGDADLGHFSLSRPPSAANATETPRQAMACGTSGSEDGVLTAEIDFRAGDVIDW